MEAHAAADLPPEKMQVFEPASVHALVRDHDRRMEQQRPLMALAQAIYETRFWEHIENNTSGDKAAAIKQISGKYEVNHFKKGVTTFQSKLFTRRMKASVGRTAATTGDPDLATLVLNRTMFTTAQRERYNNAIRMALLHPGCGFKKGYESRAGSSSASLSPHERTYTRLIPWWNLLLDYQCSDRDDARFCGELSWRPLLEVAEEHGIDPAKLVGQPRTDFLDGSTSAAARKNRSVQRLLDGGDDNDDQSEQFVRVLEFCNLIDAYGDNDYPGRYEVYILDQPELLPGQKTRRDPVFCGEMPLSSADGRPLAHIVPLIFESKGYRPLEGIAPCKAWIPLQAELNAYRTQLKQTSGRDKRIVIYDKRIGSMKRDQIASARELEMVGVERESIGGPLANFFHVLQFGPTSVNIKEHALKAEMDLLAMFGTGPSAHGIRQNVTAEEIDYQRSFTDSEFGRYAAALWRVFEQLAELTLRATVAAQLDDGNMDSDSEDEDLTEEDRAVLALADSELSEETEGAEDLIEEVAPEAVEDEDDADEEDDEVPLALLAAADGEPDDGSGEAELAALETESGSGLETESQELIFMLDNRANTLPITVEDLDSEFDIGFEESNRNPGGKAEARKALAQVLEQLKQELTVMADPSDPVASVIAYEAAKALYAQWDLPDNLDPERVMARIEDAREKLEEKSKTAPPPDAAAALPPDGTVPPPPAGPPPGAAPAGAAPMPPGAPPAPAGPAGGAPSMDPGTTLQMLVEAHGADPTAGPILSALTNLPDEALAQIGPDLATIASLPPESQVEGLVMLAQSLTGSPPPNAAGGPAPVSGV